MLLYQFLIRALNNPNPIALANSTTTTNPVNPNPVNPDPTVLDNHFAPTDPSPNAIQTQDLFLYTQTTNEDCTGLDMEDFNDSFSYNDGIIRQKKLGKQATNLIKALANI